MTGHGNAKHDITFSDRRLVDTKEYIRCPECNSLMSSVTNTSAAHVYGTKGLGRSRKCACCEHSWRTIELTFEELDCDDAIGNLNSEIERLRKILETLANMAAKEIEAA